GGDKRVNKGLNVSASTTAPAMAIETETPRGVVIPSLDLRRDLGIAALMVAAAMGIMFDAWKDIYRLGKADEELSYVLLAPVMILWLAWVRKGRLASCPLRGG